MAGSSLRTRLRWQRDPRSLPRRPPHGLAGGPQVLAAEDPPRSPCGPARCVMSIAGIAIWVPPAIGVGVWTWRLGSQARKRARLDAARTLALKHPVWRKPPGIPEDGEALTEAERRAFKSITTGVSA